MVIVDSWKPLTIITKCSILDIAAVLNRPLVLYSCTALLYYTLVLHSCTILLYRTLVLHSCMSLRNILDFAFLIWIYFSVQYLEQMNMHVLLYIVLLLKLEHFLIQKQYHELVFFL